MANIRSYLADLEAHLSPVLDAHRLQERLTEAENHLLDRAQEFEEIGLPRAEAEAQAVAAFGGPEEYVEVSRAQTLPSTTHPAMPINSEVEGLRRDVALQLAWSAIGIGLVAAWSTRFGAPVGAGFAAFFIFAGALSGKVTSLWRFALLSAVASLAFFPILLGAYIAVPADTSKGDGTGLRHRYDSFYQNYEFQHALNEFRTVEHYRDQYLLTGTLPLTGEGKVLAPNPSWNSSEYMYGNAPLVPYNNLTKAKAMWRQEGPLLHQRLVDNLQMASPVRLTLSGSERNWRFAGTSVAGGVLLMAILSGAQALGMAIRATFRWLAWLLRPRRRSISQPMVTGWETHRRI